MAPGEEGAALELESTGVGLDLCEHEQSALAREYVLKSQLYVDDPWHGRLTLVHFFFFSVLNFSALHYLWSCPPPTKDSAPYRLRIHPSFHQGLTTCALVHLSALNLSTLWDELGARSMVGWFQSRQNSSC